MNKTRLYLFIGYPGAGKTTVAKLIAEKTGAIHIWADLERHKMFPRPTHSQTESDELYERLNQATSYLLSQGKSVVFDTNFNHFNDRQKLRDIADNNNAETVIIWVKTPIETAKNRAINSTSPRNKYNHNMSHEQFDKIVSKLEEPKKEEKVIEIDGAKLDQEELLKKLGIKF